VADYKASSGLHAPLNIVVQFVLPSVHLRGADVEAGLQLALLTFHRVDHDERVRIFCETDRHQPFVKAERLGF
jgi:hypothetical protein